MNLQSAFPARLREAREAAGLTQDEAAEALGLARSALSHIESGQRHVSSIELLALAKLYGRRMTDFFAEEFDPKATLLLAFRTVGATELPVGTQREVLHLCQEVAQSLRGLENVLGIQRTRRMGGEVEFPVPQKLWEALEQGETVALEERRRLGLGMDPAPDLVDLLEKEGILTATLDLPEDVDGITLQLPDFGPFVVINRVNRNLPRRRFSLAHEYAHVLLDSGQRARVTHAKHQDDLREKRANRFAAAFLMPARGVHEFLAALGKKPRANTSVVMEGENVYAIRNTSPASESAIQPHDVVQLSHYFGVGHKAALYRLDSLGYLSTEDRERLWQAEKEKRLQKLWRLFTSKHSKAPTKDEPERFQRRFLALTLEALRRGEITWSRARANFRLVGLDEDAFHAAVHAEGIPLPIVDVQLPGGL